MLEADSFTSRLSAAIDAQDLTLGRIAARLEAAGAPISVSTLSLWRAGHVKPQRKRSGKAIEALETVLGVAPGFLTSCAAEERTSFADIEERPSGFRIWAIPQPIRERLLAEFGDDLPTGSRVIGRHETLQIDEEGRVASVRAILTLGITCSKAWRVVIGLLSSAANEDGPVVLSPSVSFGGTLGKTVVIRDERLAVFEILFDEAVHIGDVVTLDYSVAPEHMRWTLPADSQGGDHALQATTPLAHAIIEARFHPNRLPTAIRATIDDPNRKDVPEQVVDVPLQGTAAIISVDDLQRGRLQLSWDWQA